MGQQQAQQDQPHLLLGREIVTVLSPPTLIFPNEIRGTEVQAGEEMIGRISRVMIDTDRGQVAYVLLMPAESGQQARGQADRFMPVPLQSLQWSPTGAGFTFAGQPEQLRQMQGIPQGGQPTQVGAEPIQQLYENFGVSPYWQRQG